MPVFFDGKQIVTPVTASVVNDDAMLNQNLTVGNAVAYIGRSSGGQPKTILSFGTPDEAKAALIGGELCDAVVAAFAPSNDTGAPQTVFAIRVDSAQAASLDLPLATFASRFGTIRGKSFSNDDKLIRAKVEAGSATGLVSITLAGGSAANEWTRSKADVNASRVKLELLADEVEFNVFASANNTIEAVLDVGGADEQRLVIDLSQYLTLGDVADYANSLTNKAGALAFKITFDEPADRSLDSTVLDDGGYTEKKVYGMFWNGWVIKNWFDTAASDVVEFEVDKTNAIHWHEGPKVQDYKYLTAPAIQAPTMQDWTDAFSMLQTRNVQWVQAVSGNPAIHAMVDAHVIFASTTLRRERRAINGTVAGTTDVQAIAAAKALNSKRSSLVHIGHYTYDAAGKLVLRPPYMTAGLIAAMFAGSNPGTPMTNKSLRVQGLERDLRNPTDTDALLLAGVLPVENTETGYKVTQSITTWLGDSKYNNREQSCGVALDYTVRNVRQALDVLRGQKQTPILMSRAVSIANTTLTELARPEPMGPAVIVGDAASPAFRNISASIEGDVLRVQFECSPVIPNNYILVTVFAVPYSGSTTA